MSLEFPDDLKTSAKEAMTFVFNTFKRDEPLKVYFVQKEEIVVQDPNYNAAFAPSHARTTEITKTGQSESLEARIWYLDNQELETSVGGNQADAKAFINFVYNLGKVRIQITKADFNEYFKDAKKVWIFDEKFRISEDSKRVGILGTFDYIEFVLERVN